MFLNALRGEFLFSTFMHACFDFLRQNLGGKHRPSGPSPCFGPGFGVANCPLVYIINSCNKKYSKILKDKSSCLLSFQKHHYHDDRLLLKVVLPCTLFYITTFPL